MVITLSDKLYDIMEAMQNPNLDSEKKRELKKAYDSERNQESFEYNLERLKDGNMVDIEYHEGLRKIYTENLSKLKKLEEELRDIESKYNKLTKEYTEEISNVYMSAINRAKNWMMFFMGTTIGCICYIAYLVLFVK